MSRAKLFGMLLLAAALPYQVAGQEGEEKVFRVGAGVTSPRLRHTVDPSYSSEARAAGVQGTVVFQIIVSEHGEPTDITVLSPLGFGLDEQARSAIEKWKFAPGVKAGKPVRVLATVEVNFRLSAINFDARAEQQRTKFNVALQLLALASATADRREHAVQDILELSQKNYAPAMYAVGEWKLSGEHGAKDPESGLALIQNAADRNFGPALYEVARRQLEAEGLQSDGKGFGTMRRASILGSVKAQFYLGNIYATGSGVSKDAGRARQYFRLCAAQGAGPCQYRLGSLLMDEPGRKERDYVQAVAWFQLAAQQNIKEAREITTTEEARLTPEQTKWVATLKNQLVRK